MLLPHSLCFWPSHCSKSLPLTSVMPSAGMPTTHTASFVPSQTFHLYPISIQMLPQESRAPAFPLPSASRTEPVHSKESSVTTPERMDRGGHTWPDILPLSEVSWGWVTMTLKLMQEAQKEVRAVECGVIRLGLKAPLGQVETEGCLLPDGDAQVPCVPSLGLWHAGTLASLHRTLLHTHFLIS